MSVTCMATAAVSVCSLVALTVPPPIATPASSVIVQPANVQPVRASASIPMQEHCRIETIRIWRVYPKTYVERRMKVCWPTS